MKQTLWYLFVCFVVYPIVTAALFTCLALIGYVALMFLGSGQ